MLSGGADMNRIVSVGTDLAGYALRFPGLDDFV